jgi:hypothetical protein
MMNIENIVMQKCFQLPCEAQVKRETGARFERILVVLRHPFVLPSLSVSAQNVHQEGAWPASSPFA